MSNIRTQTFVTKLAYDIDMILGEEPDFLIPGNTVSRWENKKGNIF